MPEPKVQTLDLPAGSLLHARVADGDFLDCYGVVSDLPPRVAGEIITAWPAWTKALMMVRRVVTAPFGLSQDGPVAVDKLGPFPVEMESPHEIIAGFDDRHLDFRVSILSQDGQVCLATWVHPHNWGGRLYLRLILPFHVMIARNALGRVAAAT